FFFQAEDGIRDRTVTGVQTCALPISYCNMDAVPLEKAPRVAVYVPPNAPPWDDAVTMALQYAGVAFDTVWDFEVLSGKLANYDRSEERRVGKEGRTREWRTL